LNMSLTVLSCLDKNLANWKLRCWRLLPAVANFGCWPPSIQSMIQAGSPKVAKSEVLPKKEVAQQATNPGYLHLPGWMMSNVVRLYQKRNVKSLKRKTRNFSIDQRIELFPKGEDRHRLQTRICGDMKGMQ